MSNRVRLVSLVKVAVLAACLSVFLQAQQSSTSAANHQKQATSTGTFVFQLRDEQTGYGVAGTIASAPAPRPWREYLAWTQYWAESPKVLLKKHETDASGRLVLKLPAGNYLFEVNAPGYQPMRSRSGVAAGKKSPQTWHLHPNVEPEDMKRVDSLGRPGFAAAVGYVLDATTLRPIAGAEIREKNNGAVATTNARGFFALEVPVKPLPPDDPCPDKLDTVFVQASGYKESVRRKVLLYNNDVSIGMSFELERGSGTVGDVTEEVWESDVSPEQNTQSSNTTTPAWWDVKPPRRSQRQPSEEVKKWQALAPEIEKTLWKQHEDCPGDRINITIFDAAKFADDGPDIALVDWCSGGAYTDSILAMQLKDGKPVLSKTRQKDGRLTPFGFESGSSAMNTVGVRLVPEDKAIYDLGYSTDGCRHLLTCHVNAYVWNDKTRSFAADAALTRQGTQGYCRAVQKGLLRSPRNEPPASTPPK